MQEKEGKYHPRFCDFSFAKLFFFKEKFEGTGKEPYKKRPFSLREKVVSKGLFARGWG